MFDGLKIIEKPHITLTILFFFALIPFAHSQEGTFLISGFVSDIHSGEPIENVNISLKGTATGTTTNKLGQFQLNVDRMPFELEFSHVTYETRTILLEHAPLRSLQVKLTPRTESLSEVTITSQKIDTLYADRVYSVLDYELCDEGILLLIYKARLARSELILRDYSGNTLLEMKVMPMKPLALYKDCLGEIHILSQDKAYQVAILENKLSLYEPYNINYFHEVMSGCKFKVGEKVYFEVFEYEDLVKKFYYVTTTDTSAHLLTIAMDRGKMDFLRQNPENYTSAMGDAELDLLQSLDGTPGDAAALRRIRDLNINVRFNKMAYLSRIYAPFFAIHDSIVIFNHPNDVIWFFNTADSLIGETKISYHLATKTDTLSKLVYAFVKPSKWLEEIVVDEKKNKAYTLFQNLNGTKDLKEINLATGEVSYRLNIPFPYVQKIKARDDYIYFVYKGYGESQKKKLFRQQIR